MKHLRFIFIQVFLIMSITTLGFTGEKDWSTIAVYDNEIPAGIVLNEKFEGGHPQVVDYVFVRARTAILRDKPTTNSKVLKKYYYNTKLIALAKVFNYGNNWYYVKDNEGRKGYISATFVRKRMFRFQKALDKINELENFMLAQESEGREILSTHSYVPNPNNENFQREKDKYGTTLDQSTAAKAVGTDEDIYVPDRSILSVLEKGKTTSKVKVASIKEELIIPNSAIVRHPKITSEFKKVIAIDIANQNMIIFEKNDNEWQVISYVYSKTGIDSQLGFETPKGFFIVPTAKYVMPYNGEGGDKQGYARFAIRFSGGGYLHGTPLNYEEEINKEFFMKQKELTLGTFTGTRKCIRTTEEHAKFLFDWIVPKPNKKTNIQKIGDNVVFVIF